MIRGFGKRVIVFFLTVNLALAAAFLLMVSQLPNKLVVVATVDSPTIVKTSVDRPLAFDGKGRQRTEVLLPLDCPESLSLQLPTDQAVALESVVVRKCKAFDLTWRGAALSARGDGGCVRLDRSDARFSVRGIALGAFLCVEISFAVLLALVARFFRRRPWPCPADWIGPARDAAIAAVPLALILAVILPFRVWQSNAEAFMLCFADAFWDSAVLFIGVWGICFVLGFGALRIGWRWPTVLLVACGIYVYLATGLLSPDVPALTGDLGWYDDFRRVAMDFVEMAVEFGVVFAAYWFFSRRMGMAAVFVNALALIVIAMSFASLLDTRAVASDGRSREMVLPTASRREVLSSLVHSPRRNVAFYVLDSIATPHAEDVLAQSAEIRAALDGFICYTNNVGMHFPTMPGTAGILTGRYYDSPEKYLEYGHSVVERGTLIDDYLAAGADVFCLPGTFGFGMSTRLGGVASAKRVRRGLYWRLPEALQWNVYEVVRLRAVPFFLKLRTYVDTTAGWKKSIHAIDERSCYERIAMAPTDGGCALTFQYWHTDGSHAPLDVDRRGVPLGMARIDYQAKVEKTWFALGGLAEHLNSLKARGLYDNSLIVVTADHGSYPSRSCCENGDISMAEDFDARKELSIRAQPFLWIKPFRSRGPVAFSDRPTSHAKLRNLAVMAITNDIGRLDAERILSADKRLYRTHDGAVLLDCWVDACGRVERMRVDCSGNSAIPTIELAKRYGIEMRSGFPFRMTGNRLAGDNRTVVALDDFTMQFCVTEVRRRLRVKLRVSQVIPTVRTGETQAVQIEDMVTGRLFPVPDAIRGKSTDVVFDATSDANGLVTFGIKGGRMFLHDIQVEEARP